MSLMKVKNFYLSRKNKKIQLFFFGRWQNYPIRNSKKEKKKQFSKAKKIRVTPSPQPVFLPNTVIAMITRWQNFGC